MFRQLPSHRPVRPEVMAFFVFTAGKTLAYGTDAQLDFLHFLRLLDTFLEASAVLFFSKAKGTR
jgi:hypothetical protein